MKILHLLGTLEAGGAERFTVSLLCELRRRGFDVELVAFANRTDASGRRMKEELEKAGVPLLIGPTKSIRLSSVIWYLRGIRTWRPEIVHLHNPNSETMQLLVPPPWQPKRLVRTVHNTDLEVTDMHVFALRLTRVACSIFCSEASLEWNRSWVRGPTRVIPYGVRLENPKREPGRTLEARRRLGLEPGTHFIHLGRMEGDDPARSQKAQDVLIRAWRESRVAERGAVLHLLGDGNLRPRLEALAQADPSIRFEGVRGDVPDWLLGADCFLMPSRWEGLPIAGIEAITSGLPCIFSRIPPLEELRAPLVRWCNVDDVLGLARALAEFVAAPDVPEAETVDALRARFDIARAADDYADVYRSLGADSGR